MASPLFVCLGIGIFIRYWLSDSGLADWLAERNEISTPLTSWKRVTEGIALHSAGISPYDGDIFHQMPLLLRFYKLLHNNLGSSIYIAFVVCDVLTAIILERVAKNCGRYLLQKQTRNVAQYSVNAEKLILKSQDLQYSRLYVIIMYMFNPFCIATCLAKSTAVFHNLVIAIAVLSTLQGSRIRTCFFVALAAYMSFYPIMLVVPAALYLAQCDSKDGKLNNRIAAMSVVQTLLSTGAAYLGLLYASGCVEGSIDFLQSTVGFILSVPDLSPNVGLFWYFFTEMFDHFRLFFICVFQINAFIYTVPLAIKLRDHPIFFMQILITLISIFKSYPSYADTALYMAFLPIWKHVFKYMRNNFVVGCMFVACVVLAPVMWHLWIYAGSANANFYFAITLVYSTAQVFLVTDLLFGFLRREYDLFNGTKPKILSGKPAQIVLD